MFTTKCTQNYTDVVVQYELYDWIPHKIKIEKQISF